MMERKAYGTASVLLILALALAGCAADTSMLEPAPTRVEPPPQDVFVKPGPKAEEELDPALFADLPPRARAELGLKEDNAGASGATKAEEARKQVSKRPGGQKTQKAKVRISSVAVLGVRGAPGKGNAELARALRLVLRKAGWPVTTRKRPDAMWVTGRVEMGPKTPRGQRVRIKWTVRAPNGRLLGVINQSNVVPSGALDKGFGADALPAAQGAAEGIFKIVRQLRRG